MDVNQLHSPVWLGTTKARPTRVAQMLAFTFLIKKRALALRQLTLTNQDLFAHLLSHKESCTLEARTDKLSALMWPASPLRIAGTLAA